MTAQTILDHLQRGGTVTTLDSYTDIYPSYRLSGELLHYRHVSSQSLKQSAADRTGYRPDQFWPSAVAFADAVSRYLGDSQIVLE